jgi:hypothetical protein
MLGRKPCAFPAPDQPIGDPGLGKISLAETPPAAKYLESIGLQSPESSYLPRMQLCQGELEDGRARSGRCEVGHLGEPK